MFHFVAYFIRIPLARASLVAPAASNLPRPDSASLANSILANEKKKLIPFPDSADLNLRAFETDKAVHATDASEAKTFDRPVHSAGCIALPNSGDVDPHPMPMQAIP